MILGSGLLFWATLYVSARGRRGLFADGVCIFKPKFHQLKYFVKTLSTTIRGFELRYGSTQHLS